MKRPRKLKRGARVLVHWKDILSSGGKWADPKERREEMARDNKGPHVATLGFVLDSASDYLALAQSVAIVTGGDVMHTTQIPWGCVLSVARVRVHKDYR